MNELRKNPIIDMLERKAVPLGIQCFTGSTALIDVLGLTGFDYVMLDCEHSPANPRAMEELIRATILAGMSAFVRIPDRRNAADMRRALETGANGLFLPMVRSAADVRFAIDACFFPPLGERGICPAIPAANYSVRSFKEYADWNNANILLIPLIEHPEAVANIDEICALEEVKIVTFGAGDLSYAMGCGMEMMRSPKVQAAYRKVLDAARRHGVAVMGGPILNPTPETCRKALDEGVTVFCLGLDTLSFRRDCERTVSALNQAVIGSDYSRPASPPSGFN